MSATLENHRGRFRLKEHVGPANRGVLGNSLAADASWDAGGVDRCRAFSDPFSTSKPDACSSARLTSPMSVNQNRKDMPPFAEIPAMSCGAAIPFIGVQVAAALLAGSRIANMTAQPWLLMAGAILVLFLDMDAMFYLWSHGRTYPDAEAPALWLANFTITPGLAIGLVPYALEILSSFKF